MRFQKIIKFRIEFREFLIFLFADKENIVKIFIEKKPDMIDVKNDKGKTPLSVAAAVNGEFS